MSNLRKIIFELLAEKRYFYYYLAKNIPIYFEKESDDSDKKPKIIIEKDHIKIREDAKITKDDLIIALHALVSKWPERKRDFVAKHGGSVAADLAFDFATVIKAAVEADIHDRPELDLNSVKNIKNKSVERIAEEILPDGVAIDLDISVSCGLSGGSENKNNNSGGNNNENTEKNNNEKSGTGGSDNGGENSEKGSAGQGGFENFDIEDIIADGSCIQRNPTKGIERSAELSAGKLTEPA